MPVTNEKTLQQETLGCKVFAATTESRLTTGAWGPEMMIYEVSEIFIVGSEGDHLAFAERRTAAEK
jgi:hypothetical protein